MSDGEEPAKDIRSRIAAFESNSRSIPPKPAAKKPVLGNRIAVPLGQYDPLSQPSRTPIASSTSPSLSPSSAATEATRPKSASFSGGVQLPGLAARKAPPPVPGNSTRPPVPTKPILASQQAKGDQLNTSPTSVKSLQSHIPLAPSRSVSPVASPSRSPAEEKQEPSLAPSLPPRLPARKPTTPVSPAASTSNVVIQPPSPHVPSSLSPPPTRKPSTSSLAASPKPVLPPRKAGSVSSTTSSDANPFADIPLPPQRNGALSNPPSSRPSSRSRATSSSNPFGVSSSVPARSSTLATATSLPDRVLQTTAWSAKSPPPAANAKSVAPVSGSSLSTFATRAPLVKSDINGSEAASKTGMSVGPEGVRRYAELWTGMLEAAEVYTPRGQEARLDAVIVREVWKSSKLSEDVLGRIWSQCDTTRQGSLNRAEFCLGLQKVDEELARRKKY